jgi:dihydroorotase
LQSLTIRRPDDWHVHFRQGEMLAATVPLTAHHFKRALVMPNTVPPILDWEDASAYRGKILEVSPPGFDPLMTVKIVPGTTPEQVSRAYETGLVIAAKLYPDGVTTNSSDGVRDFKALSLVFAEMEKLGIVLCLHGEDPGEDVFCLDREEGFLKTLQWILEKFQGLKVVMEHLSTAKAAYVVEHFPTKNLAATVTPHHLELTLNDVIDGGLRPHHYCKPIAKRPEDRDRLIKAVTRPGQTKFFLGTDSAPHYRESKECDCGAAGVFTAPLALPLLAQIFEENGALGQLEAFTSVNGANFYGLPLNEETITLVREPWTVPDEYSGVVPLRAGKEIRWQVASDLG